MLKVTCFTLLPFNFIFCRCQNTNLRKIIADISNEVTTDELRIVNENVID